MKSLYKNLMVSCAGVVVAAVSASAQAQELNNAWYGTAGVGLLMLNDQNTVVGTTAASGEFATGYELQGSVGYGFANGLRAELDFGYGHSRISNIKVGAINVGVSGGGVSLLEASGAGYYDFNRGGISPYIGAGAGVTHVSVGAATAGTATAPSHSDSFLSLFGEIGVAFPISPSVAIVPSVRYIWLDSGDTGVESNTGFGFKAAVRYSF